MSINVLGLINQSTPKAARDALLQFDTVADMLADTTSVSEGDKLYVKNHEYTVAASGATDHHLTRDDTTTKLYVTPGPFGYDVTAFGVLPQGLGTDLSSDIQTVIDFAMDDKRGVFFPAGSYDVGTTGLSADDNVQVGFRPPPLFRGVGEGTIISGDVSNGAVISRTTFAGVGTQGIQGVMDMKVNNRARPDSHNSWAIYWKGGTGTTVFKRLRCEARSGILANNFTTHVEDIFLKGEGASSSYGIGLAMGGHTKGYSVDIGSFEDGCRIWGTGGSLTNARIETCGRGLVAGWSDTAQIITRRASVSAISMEGNDYGIEVYEYYGSMSGIGVHGRDINGRRSQRALTIHHGGGFFDAFECFGLFDETTIRVDAIERTTIANTHVKNDITTAPNWTISNSSSILNLINCDYQPSTFHRTGNGNTLGATFLQGISKVNRVKPAAAAQNLCDVNIPVANGGTSVDIAFAVAPVEADILCGAVASSGGSLTAGTYVYWVSVVTPKGEFSAQANRAQSVVVADNQKVTVTMTNSSPPVGTERRVWKGTSWSAPLGYWDIGTAGSFEDTGQAYDNTLNIIKPLELYNPGSSQEPDANYGVIVTPSWETTTWITSKATSGFTINFGTAAPDANQTVDWILMR